MPQLYGRTLQTEATPPWDFGSWVPQLVLISLGGNDYNHHSGSVPSNASFSAAYEAFLLSVFAGYDGAGANDSVVVSICGQGDPLEVQRDPDNNRCRPCPHVETAARDFAAAHPAYSSRSHYVFVPCDGSVVSGVGDIGCDGHKNVRGQAEVAHFLTPKLAQIMSWSLAESL